MKTYIEIKKNSYYDSVTLMLLSRKLSETEGVTKASVSMGTPHNKTILHEIGVISQEIDSAGANDLIIAFICNDEKAIPLALSVIKGHFSTQKTINTSENTSPKTLKSAINKMPDANLAIISIPGENVFFEAMKCLENNLHLMIFSNNVSIEDEKKLKEFAKSRSLLVMGPDCGTAIINAKPLGFANKIRRGNIGIVGASGTGIQEISVVIHKLGFGVSQAIGTGGRDLTSEIGAITMLQGIEALLDDNNTEVIVLVSKPPEKSVAQKVFEVINKAKKPIVAHFIGLKAEDFEGTKALFTGTLDETALKACKLINMGFTEDIFINDSTLKELADKEKEKHNSSQKYLRGLYTGGTLCKEAIILLNSLFSVYSNIPIDEKFKLPDSRKSIENTIIDLGEDEFTRGLPHPMIAPELRTESMIKEGTSFDVSVVLFDVMLGYGSHENPAKIAADAIKEIRKINEPEKRHITFIASICGVDEDPQNFTIQKEILEEAAVIVMPTNAQAVKLAKEIMR